MLNMRLKDRYPGCELTQAQLGEILGIKQPQVSHILLGRRRLTLPLALRMAELLGVPVENFLQPHKNDNTDGRNPQ